MAKHQKLKDIAVCTASSLGIGCILGAAGTWSGAFSGDPEPPSYYYHTVQTVPHDITREIQSVDIPSRPEPSSEIPD